MRSQVEEGAVVVRSQVDDGAVVVCSQVLMVVFESQSCDEVILPHVSEF